jgi:hypothetical protein
MIGSNTWQTKEAEDKDETDNNNGWKVRGLCHKGVKKML